jgi:acyl-CoA reductase-like NAD-dependent aldehyde dehydrogenase
VTDVRERTTNISHPDRFYIDGEWVEPSSPATFSVVDSTTEQPFLSVAEAQEADLDRAVAAARTAFDDTPWPMLAPAERAVHLRGLAAGVMARAHDIADVWARQAGILHAAAVGSVQTMAADYAFHADLADTYPFREPVESALSGTKAMLFREPVGVVGAIIPWNAPITVLTTKLAPALLSGCTVVLKASPEAPGEAYILAEIAESIGLPPGVLNVLTADRAVSERLVLDPRVDKIAFTGSSAAGRRIAALAGDRIARYTLELGGKSAAIILDDADLGEAAQILAGAGCFLSGQVCGSMTRLVVSRHRHDEFVDALAAALADLKLGDPFCEQTQMGPLAMARQRDRVEELVGQGVAEGAEIVVGGRRPPQLERGWFYEPTVLRGVDNRSTIAQTEVFGPVLSVIAADSDAEAVAIANDSVYGLNAAVFTRDPLRGLEIARRLKSGTVGFNGVRGGRGLPFGGVKQSGIGREGGREGLSPYLETKTVVLDGAPFTLPSS